MIKKFYVLILFLLLEINLFSQVKDNKILFINFQFVNGNPELVGMTAVTGKLKVRRQNPAQLEGISVNVVSGDNKVLYKSVIEDPSENVYEYPGENGEIKRTTIKQDTVFYSLRVPYSILIDRIILNRMTDNNVLQKSSAGTNKSIYEFKIIHSSIKNLK